MKTKPEIIVLQRKTMILCNFCIILYLLILDQIRREQTTMRIRLSIIYLPFHIHFPCCSAAEEADLMDAFLFFCFGLGLGSREHQEEMKGREESTVGVFVLLFLS